MNETLLLWLLGSACVAAGTTLVLVVVKLIHRAYLRERGVRSAHYVAAVGEMISRSILPEHPAPAWAQDSLFHNALIDYRLSLVGSERGFVDDLVEHLGILDVLRSRMAPRYSTSRRLEAVSTFVDLATEGCIPDLRNLVLDPSPHIAIHAAKGLCRLRDTASVGPILDRASAASPWHAARIADALTGFGYEVGEPVRQWIRTAMAADDVSVPTVALAIRVLGQVSDADAEGLLLTLLVSDEPEWRVTAASALGAAGGDGAVMGLIRALEDDHWPVRARAASSLGHLAAGSARDHLAPLLCDEMWWVRQNAAQAIGQLPGGVAVLIGSLDGDDPFASDAALYQLTIQGEVAKAAERSRSGDPTALDIDLIAHIGNLPVSTTAAPLGSLSTGASVG